MIANPIKVRRIDFSPDEWLAATVRLTAIEKGCYWTVCALIYSKGGPIDDDPRWIARNCGCDVRTWQAVRRRLLDLGKLQYVAPIGTPLNGPLAEPRNAIGAPLLTTQPVRGGKVDRRKQRKHRANGTFACGQLTNSRCEQELNKARTRTISSRSAAERSAISRRSHRDLRRQ